MTRCIYISKIIFYSLLSVQILIPLYALFDYCKSAFNAMMTPLSFLPESSSDYILSVSNDLILPQLFYAVALFIFFANGVVSLHLLAGTIRNSPIIAQHRINNIEKERNGL